MLTSTNKLTLLDSHILFHQIIMHNCFANTLNIQSLTLSLPKSSSKCFLDYSAISYAKNLKSIKIIFKLNDTKIYTISKKLLSISQMQTNSHWTFELEIFEDRSSYFGLHQVFGYDNHEDYVNGLKTKMNVITQKCGHISYKLKEDKWPS